MESGRTNLVLGLRSSLFHDRYVENKLHVGLKQTLQSQLIDNCSKMKIFKTSSRFNRRITALQWHPWYNQSVAFASHGGDIHLWEFNNDSQQDKFINGEGYGYGCITQLVFDPLNPQFVFTSSVNGTVTMRDLDCRHSEVFIDMMDISYWWTSLSYCESKKLLFIGGNTGRAIMMDRQGNKIKEYLKLHKDKIHHAEFCPSFDNLLVTSSNDRTAVLWDIRCLTTDSDSKMPRPLAVMKHNGPINSACFDPASSSRILTTAQNSELRLYESHNWEEPAMIMEHPHRHFQHMTNIKASWHPLYDDLCVVGRYPASADPNQRRGVDLVDLKKACVVGHFWDPTASQIMVLNKFNKTGDILATGMGYTAVVWHFPPQENRTVPNSNMTRQGLRVPVSTTGQPKQRRGQGGHDKKRKQDDDDGSDTKRKRKKLFASVNPTKCQRKK